MQTRAPRELFRSVEEMLEPASLGRVLGGEPSPVTVTPLESNGRSANELFYVRMGDDRLVLKHLHSDDWMARVSRDDRCRSLAVWRSGLLDSVEPGVRHGIVAGSLDGEHHALLMRDCSAGLHQGAVTRSQVEQSLVGLVGMHTRFRGDDLGDPALELTDVETILTFCWPRSWPAMEQHPDTLGMVQRGWQALLDMVSPDVRATIEELLADPAPLVRALEDEPVTLLHGDYRIDNLAFMPDGSLVALDWQLAARGPGVLDLAWLAMSGDVAEHRTWAFARYRDLLSGALGGELDLPRWERSLAVAKLAEVLRKGNWHALFATEGMEDFQDFREGQLLEYDEAVRRGAELL